MVQAKSILFPWLPVLRIGNNRYPAICLWPELYSVPFCCTILQFGLASSTLEVTISTANGPAIPSLAGVSDASSMRQPVWTSRAWGRSQWAGIVPVAHLYLDLLWALGKFQSWLILLVSFLSYLLPGESSSHFLPPLSTQDLCAHREASMTSLTSKKYILRFPALETLMLDDNKLSNPSCFASLAGLRRYCHSLPHHCPQPQWGSHPEGCILATWHGVKSQLHHLTLLCSLGQVSSLSELGLAEEGNICMAIYVRSRISSCPG